MIDKIFYSFPIQLLVNNFKRNPILIFCWLLLCAIITGSFGKLMGVPFLFLDPEYLDNTDFLSFFLVGLTCGGFSMAFHISCYISECYKFSFLGSLSKPFTRFCLNNSIIPFTFLGWYIYEIILFHNLNESNEGLFLFYKVAGLCSGFILMLFLLFAYFQLTNKDIFKVLASRMDLRMRKVKITRVNVMHRLDTIKKRKQQVKYYLDFDFKLKEIDQNNTYDKTVILKVFDQNHLNSIVIEFFIFVLIFILGIFRDNAYFQIPAAASFFLFLTILIMIAGALSFWLRRWALMAVVTFLLFLNFLIMFNYVSSDYKAFGLDYTQEPKSYSLETIRTSNNPVQIKKDKEATLEILKRWRSKFPMEKKPQMVFICTSGGGQRAALWTVKSLQVADSITKGALMKHTMLITGASGGLVGAGYFRELYLQKQSGKKINLQEKKYLDNISKDVLNPMIFSLLVNDFFIRFQSFNYLGYKYLKDRGYSFEQKLNQNTNYVLDKPLGAYTLPEKQNLIPLLFLAPNIMNDGRKLFISSQPVSYMNMDVPSDIKLYEEKIKGIDFYSFFQDHGSQNLRFLTALRMNATFPYITPNISLPSNPPMKIMDSGISDNFGIGDAIRFLYVFNDWISENTSGVIFLSIRDSPKDKEIEDNSNDSLFDKIFVPISSLYKNFDNIQDFNNDRQIEFAQKWFKGNIVKLDIQYFAESINEEGKGELNKDENTRASLSWRLTSREKDNIVGNVYLPGNLKALNNLNELIQETPINASEFVIVQ